MDGTAMSMLQDTTGILILGIALMCVALSSALRGLVARAVAQEAARRKQAMQPHVLPLAAEKVAPRRAA